MPTKTITALPLGPDTSWTTTAQDSQGWAGSAWAWADKDASAEDRRKRSQATGNALLSAAGDVAILLALLVYIMVLMASEAYSSLSSGWQATPIALGTAVAAGVLTSRLRYKHGYADGGSRVTEAHVALARAEAEASQVVATRRMAFDIPQQPTGEGFLYVVGFSTGSVKVGLTENPKERLGKHYGWAAAFGVHIINYWISPSHVNFRDNETRLINMCCKVSQRSRREYFHQVGYKRACQFANQLTYFSDNTEQTSVEGVWA